MKYLLLSFCAITVLTCCTEVTETRPDGTVVKTRSFDSASAVQVGGLALDVALSGK